jgi:predicted TPR repeat methyltransferase
MSQLNQFKEDCILLLEAGFIAVNQADEDAATKLFKSAELLDPKNTLAKVGFGYLHLHKLELKQAIMKFKEALDIEPENELTQSLMGIALGMVPTMANKGEAILEQTAKSKDPMMKKLSHTAIDFIHRFIKKPPGPAGKGRL